MCIDGSRQGQRAKHWHAVVLGHEFLRTVADGGRGHACACGNRCGGGVSGCGEEQRCGRGGDGGACVGPGGNVGHGNVGHSGTGRCVSCLWRCYCPSGHSRVGTGCSRQGLRHVGRADGRGCFWRGSRACMHSWELSCLCCGNAPWASGRASTTFCAAATAMFGMYGDTFFLSRSRPCFSMVVLWLYLCSRLCPRFAAWAAIVDGNGRDADNPAVVCVSEEIREEHARARPRGRSRRVRARTHACAHGPARATTDTLTRTPSHLTFHPRRMH